MICRTDRSSTCCGPTSCERPSTSWSRSGVVSSTECCQVRRPSSRSPVPTHRRGTADACSRRSGRSSSGGNAGSSWASTTSTGATPTRSICWSRSCGPCDHPRDPAPGRRHHPHRGARVPRWRCGGPSTACTPPRRRPANSRSVASTPTPRESWPAGPPTERRWVHQSNRSSRRPTATRCSSSRWHAAAWSVAGDGGRTAALPPRVQAVIDGRLDRLSGAAQELARGSPRSSADRSRSSSSGS